MKPEVFKKIIKDAVKEAFQEELKSILLEAVKSSNKSPIFETQVERQIPFSNTTPVNNPIPLADKRKLYASIIGETAEALNNTSIPTFTPSNQDPINGNLGVGEVNMDQIMGLIGKK